MTLPAIYIFAVPVIGLCFLVVILLLAWDADKQKNAVNKAFGDLWESIRNLDGTLLNHGSRIFSLEVFRKSIFVNNPAKLMRPKAHKAKGSKRGSRQ